MKKKLKIIIPLIIILIVTLFIFLIFFKDRTSTTQKNYAIFTTLNEKNLSSYLYYMDGFSYYLLDSPISHTYILRSFNSLPINNKNITIAKEKIANNIANYTLEGEKYYIKNIKEAYLNNEFLVDDVDDEISIISQKREFLYGPIEINKIKNDYSYNLLFSSENNLSNVYIKGILIKSIQINDEIYSDFDKLIQEGYNADIFIEHLEKNYKIDTVYSSYSGKNYDILNYGDDYLFIEKKYENEAINYYIDIRSDDVIE